jgi:hypothetical protein
MGGVVAEGSLQLEPELELEPDTPNTGDIAQLLGLDDEDDAVQALTAGIGPRPQSRAARLAALDPDDGMAL